MNEKYEKVLALIRENAPIHIDALYRKIQQVGLYDSKNTIGSMLKALDKDKLIRIENFVVDVSESEKL